MIFYTEVVVTIPFCYFVKLWVLHLLNHPPFPFLVLVLLLGHFFEHVSEGAFEPFC